MLSYLVAAFGILDILRGAYPAAELVPIGLGVAGYAVANEHRWGWRVGVVLALFNAIVYAYVLYLAHGLGAYIVIQCLVNLFFGVVLLALYLHPQSREYQRIWFR